MSIWHFICKVCGPSSEPCDHAMRDTELKILREIREADRVAFKFIEGALKQILHNQNRPLSATLKLLLTSPGDSSMPKTVAIGVVAQAVFQEWDGPAGTGNKVTNAGPTAFTSDNQAVATVDAASGAVTAVGAGTANITGTDPVNSLTASDVLTVTGPVAGPPVSATLTLQ